MGADIKRHNNVAAFVLAGGMSTRMKRDKALLELGGVPMVLRIARLAEIHVASVAVVAPLGRYASLGLLEVADHWPGEGPLGGIVTALGASSADWVLILGCDLPYLTAEWIERLISRALESTAQAIVPESSRGLDPLAAMYRKDCAPAFSAAFDRGVRRVTEALGEIHFERATADQWSGPEPANFVLQNMNTPEDFAEAQRRISSLSD
jgi:molybdopterin-guanine dinucleotide biosynthesis protein A